MKEIPFIRRYLMYGRGGEGGGRAIEGEIMERNDSAKERNINH